MFDVQTTITSCALGRVFVFQKDGVGQVGMTNSYSCEPFQCWGYSHPKPKDAKIFENHLNPVMLGIHLKALAEFSHLSTHLPGSSHFPGFFHHFVLAKLATSSIRVKTFFLCLPYYPMYTPHPLDSTHPSLSPFPLCKIQFPVYNMQCELAGRS